MKPPQFFITLILSSICVVLSVLTFWLSQSLISAQTKFQDDQMKIQSQVQNDQAEINRGNQFGQVYTNMIKDIASLAFDPTGKVKDDKLKDLLTKNNITVNVPAASPTPSK
jgi:hypothetical protein